MQFRLKTSTKCWATGALLATLTASSCTVAPKYQRPTPATPPPATYKEAPPAAFDAEAWQKAQPNDAVPRGKWWTIFNEPKLNELEEQVAISNQNLKAYEAQYRAARAAIAVTRAGLFPTVTGNSTVTGSQSSGNRGANASGNIVAPAADAQIGASFSYQADVWGKIRSSLEANVATAQATEADLETARLSAQSLLATYYFQVRGLDAQQRLLKDTVAAYEKAVALTTNRYEQGVSSKLDVVQAQTQLETTKTQLIETGVARAQYEHAIAVLIGKAPAELTIVSDERDFAPPVVPPVLPSALLERRPDIAAAERRVAAANAQIGVAQAAFYPTVGFSTSAGIEGNSLVNLFTWPSRFWSLGPSIAQTLFEAGGRKAYKEQLIAAMDASAANYRQLVLTAFQGVEDSLSTLRILESERAQQQRTVESAARSLELSMNQYKGGIVTYLQVITAQATELSGRINLSSIQTRRMVASVQLVQALGGGWDASQLPKHDELLPVVHKGWRGKAFPGAPAIDTNATAPEAKK